MIPSRTRTIVIAGVLSAIAILLGVTHVGYITFGIFSLTIMHVPVIIGAVLEGPWVGALIGLIFGVTSMIQAAVAPTGPGDVAFTNPLVSVLPRLFIGPVAWLAWSALRRWPVAGLLAAGVAGSLTNTILVVGMLIILNFYPVAVIAVVAPNAGVELVISAAIVLAVVAAWRQIDTGRKGADL
jgi:uncharacterized membrane protein